MILPYNTASEPETAAAGTSGSFLNEGSPLSSATPDQLLQSGPTSQPSRTTQRAVQVSSSEHSLPTGAEALGPILPMPTILPLPVPPDRKFSGVPSVTRGNRRGDHERSRGNGLHPVTRFTEDFDFIAMNEKFKKEEVWGDLSKNNATQNGHGSQDEEDAGPSKIESKPAYVKDDFFDSLSCNDFGHGSDNERTKFSEQRKIDVETFGDAKRYHGDCGRGRGRGHGCGGFRGFGRGGHSRGAYKGRSYGYNGRGRGRQA
ncbi:unnamed protein product [Ilex paraguariensis]